MFARLSLYDDGSLLAELQLRPTWTDQINEKQLLDESLVFRFQQVGNGKTSNFRLNGEWVLCFRGSVCIPRDSKLRQAILLETHSSPYAMHPGGNKLYRDLRELYWWPGLKREVTDYVIRTDYSLQKLAKVYVAKIVRLHGTDGQSERVIQILEDMLRSCVLDFKGSWEDFLSLAEFTYNNSYQSRPELIADTEDKILKRVGPVAYQFELPPELERIHDVFHVSMLRRYHSDPSHIMPIEEIEVRSDLTIEEEPVQILEHDVKVLRKKSVPLVKVLWRFELDGAINGIIAIA
ncbi:uncharacterized protein LOC128296580 [Gossypium arboreum]|uniref:uncharacterized protein LOC128296580 n=1 Tax=Gossypium arboreum TaxID=29729 RepID=UPI0022F1B6C6|nr:uncharacterized protein LOC128296580 [Gossypium arboreum]